jgi:2-dehydropantoate 2-reductase
LEPYIAFGELDNHPSARAEKLRQAFIRAGVYVEVPPDIQVAMWDKFLFIAAFSGVGAVTRAPAGILRYLPETRRMLEQTMQEVFEVAISQRVNLKPDSVPSALANVNNMPEQGTSSMQRDIMEGRPSELEAQNGAVTRLGREADVPVPLNTFIYSSLLPAELQARGKIKKDQSHHVT